jgi:hypothetical protein
MKKKTAKIEFKLEEDLLKSYKLFCEENGYNMSKRLRMFIKNELEYISINQKNDTPKNI